MVALGSSSATASKPSDNGYTRPSAIQGDLAERFVSLRYEKKTHQQNHQEQSVFSTRLSTLLFPSVMSTDKCSLLLQFLYYGDNSKARPQGPARVFVIGF
ncbi:Hypothetical predicted protein [Podarcis lilfordi]|uniref:Uncharacterized protein n=1 Tax=Podarcis lilfordi TaxID=74358 RepID=A0AA35KGM3_9SAUR|nr:Hypothetical predicted protein [Podarcis lilfordi]